MTTEEFKAIFYLEKSYEVISKKNIDIKLALKIKVNDQFIMGLVTEVENVKNDVAIVDPKLGMIQISWNNYLDRALLKHFNSLMKEIKISDLDTNNDKKKIATFFKENPFYED